MVAVTEEMLQAITEVLVREVKPAKIILFGSQARGDAHEHSDLDLMIIEDSLSTSGDLSKWKQMSAIYHMLSGFPVPKDILLYNFQEFEKWRVSINHVIGRASREGRVLYDRT